MPFVYRYLFLFLWTSWMFYWWITSYNVKRTVWRESLPSRLLHIVPLALAAFLIFQPGIPIRGLNERWSPSIAVTFWMGALVTITGLLISIWARRYLGKNWSATVTIKADHELIIGGPYAYARHPIYTGLLLAYMGSAIACGEWRGILAVVIVFLALWRKLRLEERGMLRQFGAAYATYSLRVAALIPFVF